jgi:hypothetical protein
MKHRADNRNHVFLFSRPRAVSSILGRVFAGFTGMCFAILAGAEFLAMFTGDDPLLAFFLLIVHGTAAGGCLAGCVLLFLRRHTGVTAVTAGCVVALACLATSLLLGASPHPDAAWVGALFAPPASDPLAGALLLSSVLALVQVRRRATRRWLTRRGDW